MDKDDYNATIRVFDMREQIKRETILKDADIFPEEIAMRLSKNADLRMVNRGTLLTNQV